MWQHTDRLAIGNLIVDDQGNVSLDGTPLPDAKVLTDEDGTHVQVNGIWYPPLISEWEPGPHSPGELVRHNGRLWVALPDVDTISCPDDHYDLEAQIGGWSPA